MTEVKGQQATPCCQLQKESEALGVEVADMLLADGAQAYLDEAYAKQDVGVGLAASLGK